MRQHASYEHQVYWSTRTTHVLDLTMEWELLEQNEGDMNQMHQPGVEPGARPWEDPMLPLHH